MVTELNLIMILFVVLPNCITANFLSLCILLCSHGCSSILGSLSSFISTFSILCSHLFSICFTTSTLCLVLSSPRSNARTVNQGNFATSQFPQVYTHILSYYAVKANSLSYHDLKLAFLHHGQWSCQESTQ